MGLPRRGVGRPGGHLAARCRGQDGRWPEHGRTVGGLRGRRPAPAARPARDPRRPAGGGPARRRRPARRHADGSARADRGGVRPGAGRPAHPVPAAGAHHPLAPVPDLGGPAPGPVRQLVRVLSPFRGSEPSPAAVGHVRDRGRAAARRRRDGFRRGLPTADPPHRGGQPQGPEQHPGHGPRRPGLAVGDRQ